MVNFLSKLDLNYYKHQTNLAVRDESYKGEFLVPMMGFVSFIIYFQSMFFKCKPDS